jgi:hypothetical protein
MKDQKTVFERMDKAQSDALKTGASEDHSLKEEDFQNSFCTGIRAFSLCTNHITNLKKQTHNTQAWAF